MIHNGSWRWPHGWYGKFPVLRNITVTTLCTNNSDIVFWKTGTNVLTKYSTKQVWKDMKGNWPSVDWYNIVWFSQLIPKHAFVLWLAIKKKTNDSR